MTRDEAIPMLCVACGVSPASADINVTALHSIVDKLIAAEREACAKVCEEGMFLEGFGAKTEEPMDKRIGKAIANAIRARGDKYDRDTELN